MKNTEYTVGTHSARVHPGRCYRCGERKPVKIETTIGRGVHLCKPCRESLRQQERDYDAEVLARKA